MSKLVIALMRDKPAPGKAPTVQMPLERRIQYAIDTLHNGDTGDQHLAQAREFLTKAREHLDPDHGPHRDLLNQIDEVL